MATAPFGPALEAALKTSIQGGTFITNSGPVVNPRFFCCISGNTVGVDKDPVAMVIPTATVVCAGAAISIDYSQSWSPTSTINAVSVAWGDGQTSAPAWPGAGTVAHPLGGYVLPGTYTITLTMTDLLGATGVDTVEITVIDCTIPPGGAMAMMYCGCGSSGVWYTADGGLTWEDAGGASLGQPLIYDVKANWFTVGFDEVELWAATENGLYRGRGIGIDITWKLIATLTLPNNVRVVSIVPSKVAQLEVYVLATRIGSTGVWFSRTVDSGETWETITMAEAEWAAMGTGTNSDVFAIATFERYVYIGGRFNTVDGIGMNYIARWDTMTETWSSMGNLDDWVNAIVVHQTTGTIYIGGSFHNDGVTVLNHVARWSVSAGAWVALGVGMDSDIQGLALAPDGTLYACGHFTTAGGINVDFTAEWNGLAWAALGNFGDGPDNNPVEAVAIDAAGRAFFTGDFTNVGATVANNVAMFDGSWHALDGGLGGQGYDIIVDDDNDVYVGGVFVTADNGAILTRYIAKWVGTGSVGFWATVGNGDENGFDSRVRGLAIDRATGIIYACGNFTQNFALTKTYNRVAAWNPAIGVWSVMDIGANDEALAVGVNDDSQVYLGGPFLQASGNVVNRITQWLNGTALSVPTVGRTHIIDMDAYGYFIYLGLIDSLSEPVIYRVPYDLVGGAWSVFVPGGGTWGGVVCDWYHGERVWAFGDFGNGDKVELSEDWGVTWTNLTDAGWGAGEIVRPLLISFYDANDVSAILNVALRAWRTGDAGVNWVNMGAIDFGAACGARDWIEDTYILIGRAAAGADHLRWSPFLGQSWFERSTGITVASPITAISIVG